MVRMDSCIGRLLNLPAPLERMILGEPGCRGNQALSGEGASIGLEVHRAILTMMNLSS